MSGSESTIQSKILKYLRGIPNTYTMKLSDRWTSGYPDILHIKDGRAYFFEVKTPTGKKQPLQIFTIAELRKAGAQAHFVTSLDEVKKALDSQ